MWKDYLTFSKKQKAGFWVLMVLILAASVYIFKPHSDYHNYQITYTPISDSIPVEDTSVLLKPFDPNHSSDQELKNLGFKKDVIRNLRKFLDAGGRIHHPDDLKKIYGMDSIFFIQIKPYIQIEDKHSEKLVSNDEHHFSEMIFFNQCTAEQLQNWHIETWVADSIVKLQNDFWINLSLPAKEFSSYSPAKQMSLVNAVLKAKKSSAAKVSFTVELNSADTAVLKLLPGIGAVLSARIVKYRNLLGGFYSINQLKEVYGWPSDLTVKIEPYIIIDTIAIKPLCVNECSLTRLKEHPYIGFYKARDIVEYRKQKGALISDINEVYQLKSFTENDRQRLHFYLSVINVH
jgi:DNA uptake protein ComE-like DNA-binding protein